MESETPTAGLKKSFAKVVVIGDSAVGKTSLIQMFEHNKFNQSFKPTIGADFSNKEVITEDRVVTLQIWDTAGQERFQSLGSAFYRGADCCVLVYDISNINSFNNLANWKQIFLQKSEPRDGHTLPFLVLGNKCDVDEGARKVPATMGKSFCDDQNGVMLFFETSAKNNVNIENAFRELVSKVIKRQEEMSKLLGDFETGAASNKVIAKNMNRRINRSTKNNVELKGLGSATSSKKSQCCT